LCNNLIAGVAAVAVSEAFRIAEGFGVDPKILTDVIAKSSGSTWLMENMHPVPGIVARASSTRDYAPGFMTDLMAKDLGLAVNAARALRVPVVVAPAAQQVLRLASSHGLGRKDYTSVYQFLKPSDGNAPVKLSAHAAHRSARLFRLGLEPAVAGRGASARVLRAAGGRQHRLLPALAVHARGRRPRLPHGDSPGRKRIRQEHLVSAGGRARARRRGRGRRRAPARVPAPLFGDDH